MDEVAREKRRELGRVRQLCQSSVGLRIRRQNTGTESSLNYKRTPQTNSSISISASAKEIKGMTMDDLNPRLTHSSYKKMRNENPTPGANQLLNKISNFFDKGQINNAFRSLSNYHDRVEFIDSVINRRKEIRHIEQQTRFERVAPVLTKVGEKLRANVLAKTVAINNFRKATNMRDSAIPSLVESDASSSLIHTERETRDSIFSPALKGSGAPMSALNTNRLEEPGVALNKVASEPVSGGTVLGGFVQTTTHPSSFSRANAQTKTSKILALLTRKIRRSDSDKSPSALVFGGSPKQNKADEIQQTNSFGETINLKELIKQPRSVGIPKQIFNLGGKVLEKDLYQFLVKNEKEKEFGNIITELTDMKEPLMKDIESRAKMKFVSYNDKKRQDSYMLPHALTAKARTLERRKRFPSQIEDEKSQSFNRTIRIPLNSKNSFALKSSRVGNETSKESYSAYL